MALIWVNTVVSVILIVNNRFKKAYTLGCGWQNFIFWCEEKELFIARITEMDVHVQESLIKYIKNITENADNVVAFQNLAECTIE